MSGGGVGDNCCADAGRVGLFAHNGARRGRGCATDRGFTLFGLAGRHVQTVCCSPMLPGYPRLIEACCINRRSRPLAASLIELGYGYMFT